MRLIDADALIEDIKHCLWDWETVDGITATTVLKQTITDIGNQPTVDAVPVRHGKWIVWDEVIAGIYHTVSECSECGFTTDKMFREEMPHCPNCGARMEAE